jgi:hypothetical protein
MLVCVLAVFQRSLRGPWRVVFCPHDANRFQQFRQSCVKLSRSSCAPAGPAQSLGHPWNASTQPDIAAGYLRSYLKSWSYDSAMHSGAYARAIPGHEKPVRDGRHVPSERPCRQWLGSPFPGLKRLSAIPDETTKRLGGRIPTVGGAGKLCLAEGGLGSSRAVRMRPRGLDVEPA